MIGRVTLAHASQANVYGPDIRIFFTVMIVESHCHATKRTLNESGGFECIYIGISSCMILSPQLRGMHSHDSPLCPEALPFAVSGVSGIKCSARWMVAA